MWSIRIKYGVTGSFIEVPSIGLKRELSSLDRGDKAKLSHGLHAWWKSGSKGYPKV